MIFSFQYRQLFWRYGGIGQFSMECTYPIFSVLLFLKGRQLHMCERLISMFLDFTVQLTISAAGALEVVRAWRGMILSIPSALTAWRCQSAIFLKRSYTPYSNIWLSCRCSRKLSMVEGRFSKWFKSVKKGVLNLFLSLSMAYNVISCQKVAENTQILKIAKFAM